MGIINDYLNGIQKRYPDTNEVREQIEELRDTLHMKTEELQSQGQPYDQAARSAVESLGDVTPLLEQVSGNMRTVNINRLARSNALVDTGVIFGTYLFGWLVFLLLCSSPGIDFLAPFAVLTGLVILALCIWPLTAHFACRKQPEKVEVVTMNYRRQMKIALIGSLGITAVLAIINAAVPYSGVWFLFPMIGIANWPLNIYLYHRQLISGLFDAA